MSEDRSIVPAGAWYHSGHVTTMNPGTNAASIRRRTAQAVSGTLDFQKVFAEVAEAAATVLPFDVTVVGSFQGPDVLAVFAIAGNVRDLPRAFKTEELSPVVRVMPGGVVRIEDSERELDRQYAYDRMLLER